jgi:hypothetical protein
VDLRTPLITFKNNDCHSATAKTVEDAQKLIEQDAKTYASLEKSKSLGDENDE